MALISVLCFFPIFSNSILSLGFTSFLVSEPRLIRSYISQTTKSPSIHKDLNLSSSNRAHIRAVYATSRVFLRLLSMATPSMSLEEKIEALTISYQTTAQTNVELVQRLQELDQQNEYLRKQLK